MSFLDDKTRVNPRPQPAPAAPPIIGTLKIIRCPDAVQVGRTFPLRGDETTIGRTSDNVIALNDPDVSSHHARIITREALHHLLDTNSTNGTHVNGSRIVEVKLTKGDVILLGSTALSYESA